jgi:hypothetical protein
MEFGFTTPSYLPPEHTRPTWKTVVAGALLALIPFVGPVVSAVYIDRRQVPGTYDFLAALKTALIQIVAFVFLVLLIWLVFGMLLGIGIDFTAHLTRPQV